MGAGLRILRESSRGGPLCVSLISVHDDPSLAEVFLRVKSTDYTPETLISPVKETVSNESVLPVD